MKYLSPMFIISLIITLQLIHALRVQTTSFWTKQLNFTLGYQCYSGYEDVNNASEPKGSASIYYSLWQGLNRPWNDNTTPLIIWLQGGPGAPSQFGCFNEIGPIYIEGNKDNLKATQNGWSWNKFGHIMCVDQPVGVGFSYNNNQQKVDNSLVAARHFITFLEKFLSNNERGIDLSQNPIYLSGESYAGHYIPAIGDEIIRNHQRINFKGILLGDGWVDPLNQANNYDSFLNSVGAVSNQWRDTTTFMQNEAITRIMRGDHKNASGYINFIIADDNVASKYYNGMNVLNYKQYDDGNINPYYYLFLQKNKKEFGIPDNVNYVDDNQEMYYAFNEDLATSFRRQLQRILQNGTINILIYNGQNDFIVNTAGVLSYMNNLEWMDIQRWKAKEKVIWK